MPHDHAACNLRNLRDAFALARQSREGGNDDALSAQVEVQPLTTSDGDIEASLTQTRAWLSAHPRSFDAVLLGMGADGHFASLFPGAANLADGLAMDSGCDAIATLPDPLPPEAPFARISLTLPRLLRAREIHLVVTGEDKRRVLRQAQQQDGAGEGHAPVAALLHARDHHVRIHWSP